MSAGAWSGPVPPPLPPGTRYGWRISIDDPSVRYLWDGHRWSTARQINPDGTSVDHQIYGIPAAWVDTSRRPTARGNRRPSVFIAASVSAAVVIAAVAFALVPIAGHTQPGLLQASAAEKVYSDLVPRMDNDLKGSGTLTATVERFYDLRSFVAPTALEVIVAEASCGCLQIPRFPPDSVEYSVPVEHSYPLSFLAETDNRLYQQPGGPTFHYLFLTLFEKLAPKAPWMITYFLASTTPHLIAPDAASTGARPSASSASRYLRLLVGAMNGARLSGSIPAGNPWLQAPSGTVLGILFSQLIADHRADVADHESSGAAYTISNFSPTFDTSIGTLECATIEADSVYHDQVQARVDPTYGSLLAPGDYATVSVHATREACVVVSRSGAFRELEGIYGGIWRVVGTHTITQVE